MVKKFMLPFLRIITLLIFFKVMFINFTYADSGPVGFDDWLSAYKQQALNKGISKKTIDNVFKDVKFFDQVIKYDRRQPEFFEDTSTYVGKRATKKRAEIAGKLLKKNLKLFIDVENKFDVEKEILLALWGIETNFGKHVGKMDIISSLAT